MDPKQGQGGDQPQSNQPQSNQPQSGRQPGYGQAPMGNSAGQPGYGQPGYGQPRAPQPQYAPPPSPPTYAQPLQSQPQYVPPPAQPGYGQPPYAQPPTGQPTVYPMGEQWAPGVSPVTVPSRSRRLRWGIAGAVVLCLAIVTTAGAFVLSGAAGAKSLTAGVAPKDSVAFMEIRTDLPGDQHAKLADFMSHFPGFQDRAQFDNALDELLNRLTREVSPDITYTSAFKPWMEGEISIAVAGLEAAASASPATDLPGMNLNPPATVVIVALKDEAAAKTWVSSEMARLGVVLTNQDYNGITIYSAGAGSAYAFTAQDLLLGTVAGVKASIDTKTKGSLAASSNYQAAMGSLSGDSLARFYVDTRSLLSLGMASYNSMSQMMQGFGSSPLPSLPLSGQNAPAWIAGSIRAESDRIVVDVAMPKLGTIASGNHVSRLAAVLPGSTVGVVEIHSIGKLVTEQLAAVQSALPSDKSLTTIQNTLTQIGGIDWLGDGVAAVTSDGSTYGGGIVAEATDAATASAKVALVDNLIALGGSSLGLTSHSENYKGVQITLIGVPASATSMPVQIAIAAKDNLIVTGYTDAFVKAVIDTTSANSLASKADYSAVMAAVGASNEVSFYVDVPTLVNQFGPALFSASASQWTLAYKPYFEHIGGVGFAAIDGNTVILRFVVTAK